MCSGCSFFASVEMRNFRENNGCVLGLFPKRKRDTSNNPSLNRPVPSTQTIKMRPDWPSPVRWTIQSFLTKGEHRHIRQVCRDLFVNEPVFRPVLHAWVSCPLPTRDRWVVTCLVPKYLSLRGTDTELRVKVDTSSVAAKWASRQMMTSRSVRHQLLSDVLEGLHKESTWSICTVDSPYDWDINRIRAVDQFTGHRPPTSKLLCPSKGWYERSLYKHPRNYDYAIEWLEEKLGKDHGWELWRPDPTESTSE